MAGTLSEYTAIALLDHLLKTGAFAVPTNLFVGLSTTDPLADGSGITEPAGVDGYAREPCDAWDAAAESGGKVSAGNTGAVTFDEATGDWGDISHFFVADDLTAGNILAVGEIMDAFGGTPTPRSVVTGDIPRFKAGQLEVRLSLTYGP